MSRIVVLLFTILIASTFVAGQTGGIARRVTRERISLWLHELSRSAIVVNNPGGGSSAIRSLAMVSGAMFEALNVLSGKYEHYIVDPATVPSSLTQQCDELVAVSVAAQKVMTWLYPGNFSQGLTYMHSDMASILTKGSLIDNPVAYANGIAVGELVAAAWITNRTNDYHSIQATETNFGDQGDSCGEYHWNTTYHPGNPLFTVYHKVQPFGVQSFNDSIGVDGLFYVPPPPALGTPAHLAEFAETREYGVGRSAATNITNTIARFHDGFFGSSTQFASDVFTGDNIPGNIDGLDALRIIAVAAMASHDAHTIHWQWKYTYRRWRPIYAYREADNLCTGVYQSVGNLGVEGWSSILPTGQNPEYPSGHSSRTGGFTGVFRRLLYNNLEFTTLSFGLPGITRTYASFTDFQQEVNDARVYGGIHWRSACVEGLALGERVADNYVSRLMRPVTR